MHLQFHIHGSLPENGVSYIFVLGGCLTCPLSLSQTLESLSHCPLPHMSSPLSSSSSSTLSLPSSPLPAPLTILSSPSLSPSDSSSAPSASISSPSSPLLPSSASFRFHCSSVSEAGGSSSSKTSDISSEESSW